MDAYDHLEFRCGTPSAEEWQGVWRYDNFTPQHSSDEYNEVWDEFTKRLKQVGQMGWNESEGDDFFFVGNDYGDRTQYLEIVKPKSLTIELLQTIQSWLREPCFRIWRIVTVNGLENDGAIMVYPSVIRVSSKYGQDVAKCIEDVVTRRLAGECH